LKARRKNDENNMNDMNKITKMKLKKQAQSFKLSPVEPTNTPHYSESNQLVNSERVGDWVCTSCNNLNFSFRKICNRCKISRDVSEVHYASMQMYNMNS